MRDEPLTLAASHEPGARGITVNSVPARRYGH
jgi:hypothetical protein